MAIFFFIFFSSSAAVQPSPNTIITPLYAVKHVNTQLSAHANYKKKRQTH